MGELNEKLIDFKFKGLAKDKEFEARVTEMEKDKNRANNLLKDKLSSANIDDYIQWLKGYIDNGNSPTHSYDYPMSRVIDKFFIAKDNFEIAPLYGSDSINIIVPKKINFLGGELGHSNLYFMDEYKNKGEIVPVYSDINFK